MKLFKEITLIVSTSMFFFIIPDKVSADSYKLEPAVEITDIQIIGNPTAGNHVNLRVELLGNIDGKADVIFKFPKYVVPTDRRPGEILRTRVINLKKGKATQLVYPLFVEKVGASIIELTIALQDVPQGYNPQITRYLKIKSDDSSFQITDDITPGTAVPDTIVPTYGSGQQDQKGIDKYIPIEQYNIAISGRVQYQYRSNPTRYRGAYGVQVALWFRNSSSPGNWYHPVYSPSSIRHTHFDTVGDEGNYYFDFSFTGDLSGYDEVLVIVTRDNEATYMPVQADGIVIYHNYGYTVYFSEAESFVGSIDGSNPNITITNANPPVNRKDAEILRNMMLSRELTLQLYGGDIPFSFPAVSTRRVSLSGTIAGRFRYYWLWRSHYIEIDHDHTNIKTTSHEFGHYVNYKMWSGSYNSMSGATKSFKEGWASFYSFATRNYSNKVYGDPLYSWNDNGEEGPFRSPAFDGFGYRTIEPDAPKFSCYLWNLYDGYSNGNFEASSYDPGDNDDINAHSLRVFDNIKASYTSNRNSPSEFHGAYKNGLSSSEQNSIDDVYNFMFNNQTDPMRAAQVKNASAQTTTPTSVKFQWSSSSYSGSRSYGNYENGYRLYKYASGWQLIQTILYGTNSYTYVSSDISGQYKLTSYNTSGSSYGGSILIPPLSIYIIGPWVLDYKQFGTFTANVNGGYGATTYQWYRKDDGSSSWMTRGTGQNQTERMVTRGFTMKVVVTRGSQNTEDTHYVEYEGGRGVPKLAVNIPKSYALYQNKPNPFNPTTTIRYDLPVASYVSLVIYDLTGREVRSWNLEEYAGYKRFVWDGKNNSGYSVPTGIYIYKLMVLSTESDKSYIQSRKMILLK